MKGFTLVSPTTTEGNHDGLNYHLDGNLVPVLGIDLIQPHTVYFEHHILLWKSPSLTIGLKPMKNVFKRMLAGIPIMLTEAKGIGKLAFSRDSPGHIATYHMQPGDRLHVREHQFLAATHSINYSYERVKGIISNVLFGGNDLFIDIFQCEKTPGILWLHGSGDIFEVTLADHESIDVEPGAWIYKDIGVRLETNVQNLSTSFFAGNSFTMNRFTGPGRVGLQSLTPVVTGAASENKSGVLNNIFN